MNEYAAKTDDCEQSLEILSYVSDMTQELAQMCRMANQEQLSVELLRIGAQATEITHHGHSEDGSD